MAVKTLGPGKKFLGQSSEPLDLILHTEEWELALISRRNPNKESGANEDCLVAVNLGEKGLVLAVADGAGGYPQADRASFAACEALSQYMLAQAGASADRHGLREWVPGAMDQAGLRVKEQAPLGRTTLTVGSVTESVLRSYQVGDSELLAMGQRGRIKHRTQSHSPVGYAVAHGELDEAEALHHPERHLVSNFLGDEHCRVEISSPVRLGPFDSLLLASDGLFDNFLAEDLVALLRKGSLEQRARALAERIDQNFSDKGDRPLKFDDVTVIIAKRRT